MYGMYMACPLKFYERYEADNSYVQRPRAGQEIVQISGIESSGNGMAIQPLVVESQAGNSEGVSAVDGIQGARQVASRGLELDEPAEGRDFGSRLHQLLHERRLRQLGRLDKLQISPEWPDEAIESEAQSTLAAYEAHWVRDYEYLESEQTHILPLPIRCPECWGANSEPLGEGRYRCRECGTVYENAELVVKLDAVVRHDDGSIGPFDTKTETRPGYNTREDWAARTQKKIYLYALERLYPHEKVSRLVLDVVTRGQSKTRRQPLFSRLDDLGSSPEAIQDCIRNVAWVAHDIEQSRKRGWWRSNTNLCKKGWERCDYYLLHVQGRTEENLKRYRAAEDYLDL